VALQAGDTKPLASIESAVGSAPSQLDPASPAALLEPELVVVVAVVVAAPSEAPWDVAAPPVPGCGAVPPVPACPPVTPVAVGEAAPPVAQPLPHPVGTVAGTAQAEAPTERASAASFRASRGG
jgi:hypothetical protein